MTSFFVSDSMLIEQSYGPPSFPGCHGISKKIVPLVPVILAVFFKSLTIDVSTSAIILLLKYNLAEDSMSTPVLPITPLASIFSGSLIILFEIVATSLENETGYNPTSNIDPPDKFTLNNLDLGSKGALKPKDDCIKNNYIKQGEIPLEVAANQLKKDKVDILHTIGGDDTNTTAGDLVTFLSSENYNLAVVGLPKTIDNDVNPIEQTLGAYTAAEHTAIFFQNIIIVNVLMKQ